MLFNKSTLLKTMAAVIVSAAVSVSPVYAAGSHYDKKTLKKMGVFLSNFTECFVYNNTRENMIKHPENIISFGICHNYVNNFRGRFVEVPGCTVSSTDDKCANGTMMIDRKFINESSRRYLNYDLKEFMSVENGYYDGHNFRIHPADGEMVRQVEVLEAVPQDDGTILVKGSTYIPDMDETPSNTPDLTAVIKPHTWNNKETWSLISIKVDSNNSEDNY